MAELTLWRSLLFLPANNQKFIEKAHTRGADGYILDLEDSVPNEHKVSARANIIDAVKVVAQDGADALVRINASLRLAVSDLEAVIHPQFSAIILPKVTSAAQVQLIAEAIDELEFERQMPVGHTHLIAQIEHVNAMPYLDEIAKSSSRMVAMTMGTEDFSLSMGMEPVVEALMGPCQQLIMACRRANILPMGFPSSIADFSDPVEFRSTIELAKNIGFAGAPCVHPLQVDILNQVYMPTEKQILEAQELIQSFKMQYEQGIGATNYASKMVDLPVVLRAENLLKRVKPQN
ncbi:HpcH/HpaI aldolase/citrate lyase family protein [Aliiglaciecola lipolytica]|uniref:Citrate lyase subunit beta n=1 Tax=Aliiglaciecola lipolytica E3 TaxID=1127673 RepID=K6X4I5_9ALTE|nr:CoA ester lyase [Aliiglaciecola lipolytica]GAC15539.1 citrate lyase subunit beta [Aliiglaciecola lipolytica E3]